MLTLQYQKYQFILLKYEVSMKISPTATYKLTLLWAFAESGLGGLLHALHVPVTGFVLGAFAVVIISLLARYAEHPTRDIMTATFLVLAVKFTVSPHSPLPAYVAVLFQGCSGALLFYLLRYHAFSLILFSVLAMIESAIQKPLLATIVFGKEIWLAIDEYMQKLLGSFSDQSFEHFSFYLLIGYTCLYAIWGLVVGIWANTLPDKLATIAIDEKQMNAVQPLPVVNKKKRWIFLTFFLLVLALLTLYVIDLPEPLRYLLRTVAILFVLYFVVNPLVRYLLKKFATRQEVFISDFYRSLPALKATVQKANHYAAGKKGLAKRLSAFVVCLLYLNLQDEAN